LAANKRLCGSYALEGLGADGEIRTLMGFPAAPSRRCVCQFHHIRNSENLTGDTNLEWIRGFEPPTSWSRTMNSKILSRFGGVAYGLNPLFFEPLIEPNLNLTAPYEGSVNHSIALSLRSWPQFVPSGEREMEKQRIAQTLKSHGIVAYQGLFILLSGGTWTDFFRRYLVLCSRLAQLASLACNICKGSLV
jgi:hypothetical protein